MSKSDEFPHLDPARVAEHTRRFSAGLDRQEERQRQSDATHALHVAAPALLAALRAILPYAESRLEDMEESQANLDCGDEPSTPESLAESREYLKRARDAYHAARAALAAAEGRV